MAVHERYPEELAVIPEIGSAWSQSGHGRRLRAVLEGAKALHTQLDTAASVIAVRALPRASLVYPARYAFAGAALSPARYVSLVHRTVLVQFRQRGSIKNLLFNPSDIEAARKTPFFMQLIDRIGAAEKYLTTKYAGLEAQLAPLGLTYDDVHYVAFDHFHTQDLRRLLGTRQAREAPMFPNAKFLVPHVEWTDWDELHPMQAAWFIADGKRDVREDQLVFTRDDLWLGDGVALVRTPGHTSGNQTLFFKTDRGVWGISENGVAADNWNPSASRVPGVASVAKHQGLDVMFNGNTLESGADQYTSMMLERTVVDPIPNRPEFFQMYPSSEAQSAAFAPWLTPSYVHGELSFGALASREARRPITDRHARKATARVD